MAGAELTAPYAAEVARLRRRGRRLERTNRQLRTRIQEKNRRVRFLRMSVGHLQDQLASGQTPAAPSAREESVTYDYLFVMAFQRSGSTLLQVLLNSIPGYEIRGENGGMVANLYRYHRRGQEQRAIRGEKAVTPGFPFYGINDYSDDAANRGIRDLVTDTLLRPRLDSRVLGFKEVNWWVDDLSDYVAFLRDTFPGARFIVNLRAIEDAAKSRMHADDPQAPQRLAMLRDRYLAATEPLGADRFVLQYDDYKDEPANLKPLFDWLGEEFDLERISELMSVRYA